MTMTVHTFYRLAVWLPIAIPAVVACLVHGFGMAGTPNDAVEIVLGSLVYGGMPYAPIAVVATFWIGSRPEQEIRRRAVQTPLWMIVSFFAFCAVLAVISRQLVMAAALFVPGAIVIVVLGYVYVVIVFALRDIVFGSYESARPESKWRW